MEASEAYRVASNLGATGGRLGFNMTPWFVTSTRASGYTAFANANVCTKRGLKWNISLKATPNCALRAFHVTRRS